MTTFSKKCYKAGNSLVIAIPKELVEFHLINEGDLLHVDLIKNFRDKNYKG